VQGKRHTLLVKLPRCQIVGQTGSGDTIPNYCRELCMVSPEPGCVPGTREPARNPPGTRRDAMRVLAAQCVVNYPQLLGNLSR